MPTMVKYSIILPVRNGGEYVKGCVQSILSQTYSDFDLIVLDNYSSDGTLEWIRSLKDERIKIFPSDQLLPIEGNWARIKTIQKHEFITLIGHDDLLDKNYLAVMDDLINKHPEARLYQTHFRYIDSEGKTIRQCKPMDEVQTATEFLAAFLCSIIDTMGTGFMMRAADYDACGGIPMYPNLLFADFELWINLTSKSYKATAANECFAFRLHQSMTTKSPDIKFHKAFEQFIKYLAQLKQGNSEFANAIEKYSLWFIEFYCKGLSHRLLRTPKQKREGQTVSSFLKNCKSYADMLVPGNDFDPCKKYSVRLAKQIDSNFLSRSLFLLFKKIRSKPVLT
ncbi:MAG TPA: glycosyltransferase [Chitinophagaceae bacterium]|jgi:glycosyltransferase involved in cell wall biosynthesis|nr:glycosyltransferase [Chitinophagaceae bacterium]